MGPKQLPAKPSLHDTLPTDYAIGSCQVNHLARLIVFFIAASEREGQISSDGNVTTELCKICILIMLYTV